MPTALYRHYDKDGVLLYVGITETILGRTAWHHKKQPWAHLSQIIKVVWYESRSDAEQEEKNAIKTENPIWNITHNKKRRNVDYCWVDKLDDSDEVFEFKQTADRLGIKQSELERACLNGSIRFCVKENRAVFTLKQIYMFKCTDAEKAAMVTF